MAVHVFLLAESLRNPPRNKIPRGMAMSWSLTEYQVGALSSSALHLILLPTEKCNFRCSYCYEDFVAGAMRSDVIQGIRALIDARIGGLETLSISWFGGEPLLAYKTIIDIQTFAQETCRAHGVTLTGSVTSNAYLLSSDRHEELSGLGINIFQISLDGDERVHDTTRILANGKSTFAKIWFNLEEIHSRSIGDAVCLLRLHLTNRNFDSLQRLCEKINACYANDQRFRVLVKLIDDYGGSGSERASDLIDPNGEERSAYLMTLLKPQLKWQQETHPISTVCYAARANSWIIRADGRLGKCTVALTDERNTIGQLLPNGELALDEERWRLWIEPTIKGDLKGMACPWQALPVEQEAASGRKIPLRVI